MKALKNKIKKKKWNAPQAKRKLYKLHSEFVLLRDRRTCQWCGKNGLNPITGKPFKFDCSHLLPREILITAFDPMNGQTLCFSCHKVAHFRSWHQNPLAAAKWIRNKIGDEVCDRLLTLGETPYEFTEAEAIRIESDLKQKISALQKQREDENRGCSSQPGSKASSLPRQEQAT